MNQGEGIAGRAAQPVPPVLPPGETLAGGSQERDPQRPAPALLAPTLPPVKSRWQKGSLTFGPVGRLAWTFVASAPLLWLLKNFLVNGILPQDPQVLMGQLFGGVFVTTWTGWIWHRILRDVWAKEVVYVPQPMLPATQTMRDDSGRHVVTLAEYVATQGEASAPHLP